MGLLDNGITWGYVVLLCVVAFVGKFLGCALAARACKFNLRESGAIGTLMSCKGYALSLSNTWRELTLISRLVELIVLNVGLQAGILDTRLFSMFVVMAIILTCITVSMHSLATVASNRATTDAAVPCYLPGAIPSSLRVDLCPRQRRGVQKA